MIVVVLYGYVDLCTFLYIYYKGHTTIPGVDELSIKIDLFALCVSDMYCITPNLITDVN